ncbi:hypothetical protein L228DRAFT_266908 [Xylona heveae TC161]|uniref:INSIG domain protein n=1 Tax=Xylona heveae (strain CBS 132557 / TC161) TaxID=1328760 RepID=A0A165I9H4_XYLHT|nr:hypothetical protein L228DRAFT_266908 [Xylona heveae TC161]KZF24584.1 hypothetical protein L228DRAFT_266908 [Xylona heveae TC161]
MASGAERKPDILRPIPRRPFDLTPASTESPSPVTPVDAGTNMLQPRRSEENSTGYTNRKSDDIPPSRTRSILNLTSSTLFGIYSPTEEDASRDEPSTPWGTGALTPNRRRSDESDVRPSPVAHWQRPGGKNVRPHHMPRHGFWGTGVPLLVRSTLLFIFGIAGGIVISHLHDKRLAPVQLEGVDHLSRRYLILWGIAGIFFGGLLPWVDIVWEERTGSSEAVGTKKSLKEEGGVEVADESPSRTEEHESNSSQGADWNSAIRGIGAFVGIALAIRKLPWQSTLQASLTLALVNPVLWYVIDRSKPGLFLSSAVGIMGTALLLQINPHMVPTPATTSSPHAFFGEGGTGAANLSTLYGVPEGMINVESIGVKTWIASVLFCSCVCFGNIGRRLAQNRND